MNRTLSSIFRQKSALNTFSGKIHRNINTNRLLSKSNVNFLLTFKHQVKSFSTNENSEVNNTEKTEKAANNETAENKTTIEELQKEIKQLKDAVIRSYAEEENVRRIAKRDVQNAKEYSNSSFAKALLDVADDIERALTSVNKEQLKSLPAEYQSLKTFYEGVEMTNKSFFKVFQQFKITPYTELNDKFDPTLHDALFQMPDPTKENGTIVQVLKKGYKLNDRVIRAAQVGTVNNP